MLNVKKSVAGLAILLLNGMVSAETIGVFADTTIGQMKFAASEVKAALVLKGFTVEISNLSQLNTAYANKKVVIALAANSAVTGLMVEQKGAAAPTDLKAQGYAMRTTTAPHLSFWVLGGDTNGSMYGGLQIAENIQLYGFSGTYDEKVSPDFLERGVKLNLPLDSRIPTYSGFMNPTGAKNAIPNVWDIEFWKTWLDEQARNRYNVLSVWVHHPFPALVVVPEYPLASLPSLEGENGWKKNLNADQRIAFWKEVMNYAHSRGFSFYFFCWNVTVDYAGDRLNDNGSVDKAGKYSSITDVESNNTTIDYLSKCMTALLTTYPELDGFGISAGDNMSSAKEDRPAWTWKAYGKAALAYAEKNPDRKFTIIHRGLGTSVSDVYKDWLPLTKLKNFKFDYSIKYANAHIFSTITPRAYDSDLKGVAAAGQKTWLTLRNDDYFFLDWGDPKFVRDFLDNIPQRTVVNSFYIGSDIHQPTRTYWCKDPSMNGQLEIQKNWYIQMLWGRISYNRQITDNVFKKHMELRYPQASSENLFTAWSRASRALPKFQELTGENWHLDAHWYAEGSIYPNGGKTIFRTITDMATTGVAKTSPLCNIPTSAKKACGTAKTSYMLADEMEADAMAALNLANVMTSGGNTKLEAAINNVKQLAYLANYLANKIRGATFKAVGDAPNKTSAKDAMGKAYCWWMTYSKSMGSMYTGNEFRTVEIAPDWTFGDAYNLKEFTDLGGTASPKCDEIAVVDIKTEVQKKKPISIQFA
jgi:hypothetical protein